MGIFDFWKTKQTDVGATPKITPTGYEAYGVSGNFNILANGKQREYLNEMKGWVGSAVSVIADEVASLQLHLYQYTKGGGVKEVEDHPILDLLYKVNNYTTKFDHFWLTQTYLELVGEAPWFLERGATGIDGIYLLRPDKIRLITGKSRLIEGYEYDVGGTRVRLSTDEVIFLKYPNPAKPFRGLGTLEMAAKTTDIDNYAEEWNKNFYLNAARPDAILTVNTSQLNDDQKKKLKESLKESYEGIKNAHKVMILFGDMKFEKSSFTMKDMDFLEQQKFSRDKILGIFRVPKAIVAQTEGVNFASADVAQYVFARWTIKPKLERMIQQLNEFLLPMFDGTENMFLDYEDVVPEDETKQLAKYQNGLQNGWLTINEVREEEGLEAMEGGDEIYVSFGLHPLSQAAEPPAPPTPPAPGDNPPTDGNKPAPQDPNADPNADTSKEGQKRYILRKKKDSGFVKKLPFNVDRIHEMKVRGKSTLKAEEQSIKLKEQIKDALRKEYKDTNGFKKTFKEEGSEMIRRTMNDVEIREYWTEKNKIYEKYLILMRAAMVSNFQNQRKTVLTKLNKQKSFQGIRKSSDDIYNAIKLDLSKEVPKTLKITLPILTSLFETAANRTFELLQIQAEMDMNRDEIKNLIRDNGRLFATNVAEATNDFIREELVTGLGKGESIPELSGRIKNVFDQAEDFRADRIAKTETLRYNTSASEQAFIDSEIVEGKMWVTDPDPCDYCAVFAGKTAGLGDLFAEKGTTILDRTFDYDDLPAPPLHPNCRCDIVPIFAAQKIQKTKSK